MAITTGLSRNVPAITNCGLISREPYGVRSHGKRDCRNRHHIAALASVSGGTAVRGGDTASPQGWRSAVHGQRLGRRLLPTGAGPSQGRDHLPARRQPHTRGPWSGDRKSVV